MGDVSAEESVEETENERNEPRIYEVGYHLVSNIPEEKLAAEAGVLKDTLAQEHAVVIAEAAPKRRLLAYPIRMSLAGTYQKFDAAYFGCFKFEVGPE